MIGKKRTRGWIADLALYAPLVLLPFVWFATTACFNLLDSLGSRRPDAYYNGTPVSNYPDQTRFGSGNEELVCTVNGNYVGGGGGGDEATRAGIQASIERNKREISETESRIKRCKGGMGSFNAETGCNERRQRQLNEQNAAIYARGERNAAITAELDALELNCRRAENNYIKFGCSAFGQSSDEIVLQKRRAALAKDESTLAQLN